MFGILFGSCACCNEGGCPDVDGGTEWATWTQRKRPDEPDEKKDASPVNYNWPGGDFQYPVTTGHLSPDPNTDVPETPFPQFPNVHWPRKEVMAQNIFGESRMILRSDESLIGPVCFRLTASIIDRSGVLAEDMKQQARVPMNAALLTFAVTDGFKVYPCTRKLRKKITAPAWLTQLLDQTPNSLIVGNLNHQPLEYICTLGIKRDPPLLPTPIFLQGSSNDWNIPSTIKGVRITIYRQNAL